MENQTNVICFHNPDEPNGYLSNWALTEFAVNGIVFSSGEQYMMYQKAKVFLDSEIAEKIMNTTDVAKIKALGRKVRNFDGKVWDIHKVHIMTRGLTEKFRQNPELKEMLLATGTSILAECAVNDKIWGIGLSMRAKARFEPEKWKGKNLLGKILMDVRNILKEEKYQKNID